MGTIERASPHDFGEEDVLALAARVQAVGSLSRDQVAGIKALAEVAGEIEADLVASLGNTGYNTVRQDGSRSQSIHWAPVYY